MKWDLFFGESPALVPSFNLMPLICSVAVSSSQHIFTCSRSRGIYTWLLFAPYLGFTAHVVIFGRQRNRPFFFMPQIKLIHCGSMNAINSCISAFGIDLVAAVFSLLSQLAGKLIKGHIVYLPYDVTIPSVLHLASTPSENMLSWG